MFFVAFLILAKFKYMIFWYFCKEEMTDIYLFKKFDFCKGIPLRKSNFLKW
eukprot:UN15643